MEQLARLWKRLTLPKHVEQAGTHQKVFLGSVYRMYYCLGFSTDNSVPYLLYATAVKTLIAAVIVGEILYLFMTSMSLDELVSSFNAIIIHLIAVWKLKTTMDHKDLFKKLSKSMESPYFDINTERRSKIMEYWKKRHDKFFGVLLRLSTCTVMAWSIFPMVDDLDYNLMINIYFPFKYDTIARYVVVYLIMVVAFVYVSCLVVITESLMQAHLLHLICQYAVLADCFVNIIEDCVGEFRDTSKSAIKTLSAISQPNAIRKDIDVNILTKDNVFADQYLKRLKNLVQQHKYILQNTMDMKTILSSPMLGQLTGTGILICLVAYQANTTMTGDIGKFLTSLLYLGCVMFTFYVTCASCEEIAMQSESIGQAAYFSGWESGLSVMPGVKATIIMVIARSSKPLIFLAGGMYPLSLRSYASLVKASYSAFTILLRADH